MARQLPGHVRTRAQARQFFEYLYEVDEVAFHPDDPFWDEGADESAYGSREGPLYTRAQARVRDRLLDEACVLLGNDVYEVSTAVGRELGYVDPAEPDDLPTLPESIGTREDMIQFFMYLYAVDRIAFHPNNRFWNEASDSSEYVTPQGEPVYTRDQARVRQEMLDEAWGMQGPPGYIEDAAEAAATVTQDIAPWLFHARGPRKKKRKGRKHWEPE